MIIADAKNVRLYSSLPTSPLVSSSSSSYSSSSSSSSSTSSSLNSVLGPASLSKQCETYSKCNTECSPSDHNVENHCKVACPRNLIPLSGQNEDPSLLHQSSRSNIIRNRQPIPSLVNNNRPEQSYSINTISISIAIAKEIHNSFIESNTDKKSLLDSTQTVNKNYNNKVVNTTINQGSDRLDVRELLLLEKGPKGWFNGQVLRSVEGVVVYKGLLKDDTNQIKSKKSYNNSSNNNDNNNSNYHSNHSNNSNPYEDFRKKQQADYERNVRYYKKEGSNIRKCSIILRDTHRGEIVTIYMPVTVASAIMVGFRIVICNSTIHLSENLRTLYLKYSSENKTQIGKLFFLIFIMILIFHGEE